MWVSSVRKAGAGNGAFHFQGGKLVATQSTADFMGGLTAALVEDRGAWIDSNGHDITISQPLVAARGSRGGLIKTGQGGLKLSGSSSYTGSTVVEQGSLFINGSIGGSELRVRPGALLGGEGAIQAANTSVAGTLAPGGRAAEPGGLQLRGLQMLTGSTLEIEVAGDARFDQLIYSTQFVIELDATLSVTLRGGFSVSPGTRFLIASGGSEVLGNFSNLVISGMNGFIGLQAFYYPSEVWLASSPVLDGDFNADGTVGLADYTVWRDSLGGQGIGLWADANLDGRVDTADYAIWKVNFGKTLGGLSATPVPQPTSATLAILGLALLAPLLRSARF